MHNSSARVHVLADGTVVVDDGTGAVELALKTDVEAVETFLGDQFDTGAGHTHLGGSGAPVGFPVGGSGSGSGFSVPTPVGTSILKGK